MKRKFLYVSDRVVYDEDTIEYVSVALGRVRLVCQEHGDYIHRLECGEDSVVRAYGFSLTDKENMVNAAGWTLLSRVSYRDVPSWALREEHRSRGGVTCQCRLALSPAVAPSTNSGSPVQ